MFSFMLACSGVAQAGINSTPGLSPLIEESDVICIAKIIDVTALGRTNVDVGYRGKDGEPFPIDTLNAVADVVVEAVLKGKPRQTSFRVTFFKNVYSRGNAIPFTELVKGEKGILFLASTDKKDVFTLTEPASHGRSKISLGSAKLTSMPLGLTPLRAVLWTVTDALPSNNKPIVLDCLQRLASVGYLLLVKPGIYSDEAGVTDRLTLGEPVLTLQSPLSSLEQFVKTHIAPAVLSLTKDADADTSEQAFITLGQIQDATAIPDLVRIADKNYQPDELGEAAFTIGGYRTPEAVRPLILTLDSKNNHVRHEAIDALRELNNPLALPFLIDRLDDSDPDVRLIASQALFTITGEVGSHLPPGDDQSLPARELAFWKKWAAEHQDRIKALRAQFKADAPATPAR